MGFRIELPAGLGDGQATETEDRPLDETTKRLLAWHDCWAGRHRGE